MTVGLRPRLTTLWVPLLLAAAVAWLGIAYLARGMDGMSPTAMGPVVFGLAWLLMMAAMSCPAPAAAPTSMTPAGQMPGQLGRFLISCCRVAFQELKFAIAGAQPTP